MASTPLRQTAALTSRVVVLSGIQLRRRAVTAALLPTSSTTRSAEARTTISNLAAASKPASSSARAVPTASRRRARCASFEGARSACHNVFLPADAIRPTPKNGGTKPFPQRARNSCLGRRLAGKYDPEQDDGGDSLNSRLDEDKLDQLRRWGTGLAVADDQELRATGKAILLLIEEIEALHVELWNAKTAPAEDDGAEPESEAEQASLERTLGARLRRLGRRSAAEAEAP